jgi:hypothetical protein
VIRELDAARFEFDEPVAKPDKVGAFGALTWEADVVFGGGALGQRVGIVAEGSQQMEEERLGFALLVSLELGGELGQPCPMEFRLPVAAQRNSAKAGH